MNLKDILEYAIIKTDSFNITVYNLIATILILLITRIIIGIIHKIFRDIISGLFILFEGNLKVNVVELDDEIGKVKEIGF